MNDPKLWNHRIVFQKYNGTVDDYGEVRKDIDSNWDDYKAAWAAIDPISGKEFYEAQQSQSSVSHKIRCRYIPGITTEMRIKFGSRIFEIISAINWGEKNEDLLIMAQELVK